MSAQTAGETIDLKVILKKLVSKWWLFAITVTLSLAVGVAKIKTTPKHFLAEGVILMSEKKRNSFGATNDEFLKGTSYLRNSGDLEDQISILISYNSVKRTIRNLDFQITYLEEKNFLVTESYTRKPFIVQVDSTPQITGVTIEVIPDRANGTYRVKAEGENVQLYDPVSETMANGFVPDLNIDQVARMGEPFRNEHLNMSIEFPEDRVYDPGRRYFFIINSLDGLTSYYRGKTSVNPLSDESNIVLITTTGEAVQKELDYINMLMSTYIDAEQQKHESKGLRTIEFIESQLDESKRVLTEAEGELQGAQTSGGSLLGGAGGREQALFAEVSRLQDEQGRLRGKLDYLNLLINKMSSEDAGNPSTISASNLDASALNNLIDQYNKDVNQLSQNRLTERIPSAPTIALNRKVQTERDQIIQTAQDVQRASQLQMDQLTTRIAQLRGQLNMLPSSSRKVTIATRKYELSEEIHNYLMEKRYEAQIAVNSDQVDKYVVDEARLSTFRPISPNKKVILGGALMIGLLLPVAFILIRDLFDDRIADVDELKRLSRVPVLALIPSGKRKRVLPDEPKSMLAESFRTARINLKYLHAQGTRKVVGFTSTSSGEGKTFCAVNLATVMALGGKRTLIIDADMRRPRLGESLGLPDGDGLSSYLVGECTADQVIRASDIPGMDVITAGPIPPNPIELMESERLERLLADMKERYDHIIVDASPMGLVSEFVVLLAHLDITLYVVRRGFTRRNALRSINELYQDGKLKHVNLLFNDVKAGQGYGEGYGYYTK